MATGKVTITIAPALTVGGVTQETPSAMANVTLGGTVYTIGQPGAFGTTVNPPAQTNINVQCTWSDLPTQMNGATYYLTYLIGSTSSTTAYVGCVLADTFQITFPWLNNLSCYLTVAFGATYLDDNGNVQGVVGPSAEISFIPFIQMNVPKITIAPTLTGPE